MKEHFYETGAISKEQINRLMERSDGPALLRFSVQFLLFVAGSILAVWQYGQNAWLCGAGLLLQALFVTSMFAVGHETVHRTAFRSRAINEWAGALACFSIFYIPEWFRHFHFAHHRHTHDPEKDPELAPLGFPFPLVTDGAPSYLAFLSGIPVLAFKLFLMVLLLFPLPKSLWAKVLPYLKPSSYSRIQWQARGFFLLYAGMGAAGYFWLPHLWIWMVGQAIGHGILSIFLVAEHSGLPHEGSILERTRTTKASSFVQFLMWNMPYHAEHHAYPAIPWHALPKLHCLMESELLHQSHGYSSLHRRITGQVIRGKPFVEIKPNPIAPKE